MTDRELMQQALEGLEEWRWGNDPRGADVYIDALRGRVEQLKPLRPWVGLTMLDMAELRQGGFHNITDEHFQAIEAKLKEKNT